MSKKNSRERQNETTPKDKEHEFSEELADGGERNEVIKSQEKPMRGVRLI